MHINNNKFQIVQSYVAPNPLEVRYWADLTADPTGAIIKVHDGEKWAETGVKKEEIDKIVENLKYESDRLSHLIDNAPENLDQLPELIAEINKKAYKTDVEEQIKDLKLQTFTYNPVVKMEINSSRAVTKTSIGTISVTNLNFKNLIEKGVVKFLLKNHEEIYKFEVKEYEEYSLLKWYVTFKMYTDVFEIHCSATLDFNKYPNNNVTLYIAHAFVKAKSITSSTAMNTLNVISLMHAVPSFVFQPFINGAQALYQVYARDPYGFKFVSTGVYSRTFYATDDDFIHYKIILNCKTSGESLTKQVEQIFDPSSIDEKINTAVSGVYKFKGSKASKSALPTSDNTLGDVWNVTDTDMNYAWTGSAWDPLGSTVTVTVDSALSSTSTNAIQNKAVYEALQDKADAANALTDEQKAKLDKIKTDSTGTLFLSDDGTYKSYAKTNSNVYYFSEMLIKALLSTSGSTLLSTGDYYGMQSYMYGYGYKVKDSNKYYTNFYPAYAAGTDKVCSIISVLFDEDKDDIYASAIIDNCLYKGCISGPHFAIPTKTVLNTSSIDFLNNGDGSKYLADNGTYKTITMPTIDTTLSSTSTNAIQNKAVNTALSNKVDKVSGKQLSTNDYTTDEKTKLSGIATGAQVNVQSDWNATSGDAFIKNKPSVYTKTEVDALVGDINTILDNINGETV